MHLRLQLAWSWNGELVKAPSPEFNLRDSDSEYRGGSGVWTGFLTTTQVIRARGPFLQQHWRWVIKMLSYKYARGPEKKWSVLACAFRKQLRKSHCLSWVTSNHDLLLRRVEKWTCLGEGHSSRLVSISMGMKRNKKKFAWLKDRTYGDNGGKERGRWGQSRRQKPDQEWCSVICLNSSLGNVGNEIM